MLLFRSDPFEVTQAAGASEAANGQPANRGFELVYIMDGAGCNPAANTG